MTPSEMAAPVPPGGGVTWVEWLHAYTLPSLQTLCRTRGIPVREGATKAALIRLVEAELFRTSLLRPLVSDLQPGERAWLDLFGRSAGVLSAAELRRNRPTAGIAALRRLAARGLVLPGPFDGQVPQGTFDIAAPEGPLWCPEPVSRLYEGSPLEPTVSPYRGPVTSVRDADFRVLEHDLMALADEVRQRPVRRLKSGFPGKRFLARVAERLRVPVRAEDLNRLETSGRLLLVYDLLHGLGVLRPRHDRLTTSAAAEEFYGKAPLERIRRTVDAWVHLRDYNEMYRVKELDLGRDFPDYDDGDGTGDDLPTPEKLASARLMLLSLAGRMPHGEWIPVREVANAAFLLDDAFLIREPQSYFYSHAPLYHGIYLRGESGGVWSWGLERAGNWPLVEGRFIREVFTESLFTLGIVDVASTPEGDPLVRLNGVGAWLLAQGPEPGLLPPPGPALVVQPNFDIVVFPEGQDASLLWPLLQAADPISRDVTLTLRLTADSIHRASERNISAEEVLKLLAKHARGPIPMNVRQAMEDWDQRFQQVAITTYADLVEAESPERFARLLADVNGEQTTVRPLSETVGLVVGPLSRLPQMTTFTYREPLPPSVTISADLDIAIDPARENWLIGPCLRPIAEQTGPNTFRLTRESVARGAAQGHFHEETLELLRQSAVEGLPARAAFKLQGLFGRLGPASVGKATLVQMSRESVLTAMLEIEDFRRLILQRLGPTTALICDEHADDLLAKLSEFGIPNDAASLRDRHILPFGRKPAPTETQAAGRATGVQTYSSRKTRELLEEAVRRNLRVRLRYRPHAGGRPQERTVDPIDVGRRHGVAYLTAYCHLRGEVQIFRIPAIVAIELLDAPVSPR